jgi:predicted anti-sigma-YlaC factor YlaD
MMHCEDIHRRVAAGESLEERETQEHLQHCPACREVAADGAAVGRALAEAAPEPAPDPGLDSLFERVQQQVHQERGVGAWLRSRRTAVRCTLAGLAVALIALIALIVAPRGDLAVYPLERMALTLAPLALLIGVSMHLSLRPLHRPPPPAWVMPALAVAAVAVPAALALLPQPHVGPEGMAAGQGLTFAARSAACFAKGSIVAVALLGLWRTLDRSQFGRVGRRVFATAAAGAAANFALQCHCAVSHPLHLLLGHAAVAIAFVAAAATWWSLRTAAS